MRNIYSHITLTSGTELIGNRPPTHHRYHPLIDDSRLIPVVSPEGRVTYVSIDAIAAIEILKAPSDFRGVSGQQPEPMSGVDEQQFGRHGQARAMALLESFAWGDMDLSIRTLEDALRRAVEATRARADHWDQHYGQVYEDEFSVNAVQLGEMGDKVLLAYVGRLVRSLALVYGVSAGPPGEDAANQEKPGTPAALLRGLNGITDDQLTYKSDATV